MESATSIDFVFLLVSGTLAFLVMASSIVFFVISYRRKMLLKDLEMKNQEAIHQKDLFDRNLEATEKERHRVARELHDEVGSSLSMMRLLSTGSEQEHDSLRQLIDTTIDNVRRISNDLLPNGLDEFGLAYALEILFDKVQDTTDIEIETHLASLPVLDSSQNLMVYRLIQEMLHNSVKYAETDHIFVSIGSEQHQVKINYKDFGKPFDLALALKKNSLGLKNLSARSSYLGGYALLNSTESEGFTAEIVFPIAQYHD